MSTAEGLTLQDFIGNYQPMSPMALAMLCAWNNIPEGRNPPSWALFPGPSVDAWNRVAEAALKFVAGHSGARLTEGPLTSHGMTASKCEGLGRDKQEPRNSSATISPARAIMNVIRGGIGYP